MVEYEVQQVDKPEESCCILLITGKGGLSLSREALEAAAVIEKRRFETETGRTVYRVSFDPLAGGLRPQREPGRQLFKAGIEREEVFNSPPNGGFKRNPETGEQLHAISAGKVGPVLNDGAVKPSNILRGENVMIPIPGVVLSY